MNKTKCYLKQVIELDRVRLEIDLQTGQWNATMSLGGGYLKSVGKPFEVAEVDCPANEHRFILSSEGEVLEISVPTSALYIKSLCK